MRIALAMATGVFWTITYILIIWRGFADRTYGMPVVALAANLAWELIFGFLRPGDPLQTTINIIWFCFDLVIVYTFVRFGRREFPGLAAPVFYGFSALVFLFGYLGVLLMADAFDNGRATIVAFAQNLLMSALFLAMLWHRRSTRGQSVWIGIGKLLGTASASAMSWFYLAGRDTDLLIFLYVGCFLLDLIYVVAVVSYRRQEVGLK